MRKDAGFEVMNHIVIYCDKNEKIADILKRNAAAVSDDTLADDIVIGETDGYTAEWDINGEKTVLGVKRV